jgi:hypothetical protein
MNRTSNLIIVLAVLAIVSAFSFPFKRLSGSGANKTETRNVSSFTGIEANGSSNIEVVKGSSYQVKLSGYANLIPAYETKVSGGTLTLQFDDDYNSISNNNLKITVYTPDIKEVELNGSGDIVVNDGFKSSSLTSEINGSGDITIKNSSFNTMRSEINGSGSITSSSAVCDNGVVSIVGSGDIYINARKSLKVDIAGSGDVYVYGNPADIKTDIAGSGRVKKMN